MSELCVYLLNQVKNSCKSSCEHYDDLGRQFDIMFAVFFNDTESLEVPGEIK